MADERVLEQPKVHKELTKLNELMRLNEQTPPLANRLAKEQRLHFGDRPNESTVERLGPEHASREWGQFYAAVKRGITDLRYEEQ